MRAWVLSDLHLTSYERALRSLPEVIPAIPEADIAIVAGDVGDGVETSALWLARHIRPHMKVAWVLGNHEFYGGWFRDSRELARRRAAELDLILLDDDVTIIDGVRLAGSTLWTDYDLYARGDEAVRREHMFHARWYLNDHRQIDLEVGKMDRFLPLHARAQHLQSRAWLDRVLAEPFAGDTIVITHHAPSTNPCRCNMPAIRSRRPSSATSRISSSRTSLATGFTAMCINHSTTALGARRCCAIREAMAAKTKRASAAISSSRLACDL
jgi:3',5'-cyclic AMP phosphodiesterase CpdA